MRAINDQSRTRMKQGLRSGVVKTSLEINPDFKMCDLRGLNGGNANVQSLETDPGLFESDKNLNVAVDR